MSHLLLPIVLLGTLALDATDDWSWSLSMAGKKSSQRCSEDAAIKYCSLVKPYERLPSQLELPWQPKKLTDSMSKGFSCDSCFVACGVVAVVVGTA